MNIEIREVGIEEVDLLAQLFSDHLDEQCGLDQPAIRLPAFNARDFVEAMLNPKLNQFYAAWDGDRMAGFIRLGILCGEGLLPLATKVNRMKGGYLKRLPVTILRKLQNVLELLIGVFEKRATISAMLTPQTCGYIADLFVIEEYRRKGVGSELVEQAMGWFKSMGLNAVELYVLGENEPGCGFWKSKGFSDRRILVRNEIVKIGKD